MTVEYRIGDALAALESLPAESAQFIHLDDAWARPNRNGAFGGELNAQPNQFTPAKTHGPRGSLLEGLAE